MNERTPKLTKTPDSLIEKLHELEREEETLKRKLVKKVYLIVFAMIATLVTIIIVEFKEFSFNTTNEYKIGKNRFRPKRFSMGRHHGNSTKLL